MLTLLICGAPAVAPLPLIVVAARIALEFYAACCFVFCVEVRANPDCLRLSVCCSLSVIGFEFRPVVAPAVYSAPDCAEDTVTPSCVYARLKIVCIFISGELAAV